jgi:hypothetical protein
MYRRPVRRRSARQATDLSERLLDLIAEDFEGGLAGVDYDLRPELSNRELAGALVLAGLHAWRVLLGIPPVSEN